MTRRQPRWASSSLLTHPGSLTGIRFYKASTNTGTHTGSLWSADGQLLASATFTNESASGWQQVDFSQPVPLSKDTTYVASYFAPNGHYSQDGSYFYTTPPMGTNPTITNVDSPPLHALRNTNGTVNGVYSNSGSSTFPTSSANASNYWVDVVFSQSAGSTPPAVTGVTPGNGATGVAVSVAPTATFSQAVQPSTVSFTVKDSGGNGVAGTVGFNGGNTVATFTPASSLTAEHHVHGDGVGGAECLGYADERPVLVELHHRGGGAVPVQHLAGCGAVGRGGRGRYQRAEPGRAVQAAAAGSSPGSGSTRRSDNTGTHTGSLWAADGTLLATGHVQR